MARFKRIPSKINIVIYFVYCREILMYISLTINCVRIWRQCWRMFVYSNDTHIIHFANSLLHPHKFKIVSLTGVVVLFVFFMKSSYAIAMPGHIYVLCTQLTSKLAVFRSFKVENNTWFESLASCMEWIGKLQFIEIECGNLWVGVFSPHIHFCLQFQFQ